MHMLCLNMISGSAVLLQQVLQHYLLLVELVLLRQMMARELPPLACHTPDSWSTLTWVALRRWVIHLADPPQMHIQLLGIDISHVV